MDFKIFNYAVNLPTFFCSFVYTLGHKVYGMYVCDQMVLNINYQSQKPAVKF